MVAAPTRHAMTGAGSRSELDSRSLVPLHCFGLLSGVGLGTASPATPKADAALVVWCCGC